MRKCFLAILFSCAILSCAAQMRITAPVKGTWVTNVAGDALLTKEKVAQTVRHCKAFGLNTIYVVTWNKGVTMYPSSVVEKYIGTRQDLVYKGFDPIKEVIGQGHKAGIKVIAWFEYGFAYD